MREVRTLAVPIASSAMITAQPIRTYVAPSRSQFDKVAP